MSPGQNWLVLSSWEGLIFLQTIQQSINILPLSRLKFGYMKFYQVIYAFENRKMVFSQSDVYEIKSKIT